MYLLHTLFISLMWWSLSIVNLQYDIYLEHKSEAFTTVITDTPEHF